ncbi:MAG: hypothetical protein J7599_07660 [Niabella sp.]|nr:hypothetical protein [Niabella sp.]
MKLVVKDVTAGTNNVLHFNIGPSDDVHTFAYVFSNEHIGVDLKKAKEYATLFALAPEMLEVLQEMVQWFSDVEKMDGVQEDAVNNAKAIIQKATTI